MEYSELIPRTKMDYERVALLKRASKAKIIPILPELLMWLQDMNWPIAQDIEDILVDFEEYLIPHIRAVIKTNDGGWKFFLLHGLINRLSNEKLLELKPELIRMRFSPTKDEIEEELTEKIDELLARID
ncbi:DUF5071 domain-containing protein [Paenibacillus prosopidis]|uniref:Uncharacterized protein DUF5071 n=1 Tax=Paenibacillus prosopidis TaxID=630520 RepID=A0A368VHG0_9BACL|nr:DUF5071 domain-containing protein [Paenibacillus prosopidis]RCW40082.1 uncharacterized protein DUF5071 [Paenibacillus prosopidis]